MLVLRPHPQTHNINLNFLVVEPSAPGSSLEDGSDHVLFVQRNEKALTQVKGEPQHEAVHFYKENQRLDLLPFTKTLQLPHQTGQAAFCLLGGKYG